MRLNVDTGESQVMQPAFLTAIITTIHFINRKRHPLLTVAITQCCSQQFIAHLQLYLHLHLACRRTDGGKLSMASQEPFSLVEDRA